ncbi:porin family protein [Rufibacter psychrotolerans]|uniref:porin family protein n=1 Tax=Rufibacter psychrotolerans TaxID=2812556 RepID=UPI0019672D82|nr:porin family protein [Rufibacter sp. SYSU D00308]
MKHYVALLVLLLVSLSTWAQHPRPLKAALGLQAGPAYTHLRGNPTANALAADLRFAGGLFFRHRVKKAFARIEVLYENKGSKEEGASLHYDDRGEVTGQTAYTLRQHFHYLTVPVMVEFPVAKTGLHVALGPYLGFLLKQDLEAYDENLEFTAFYRRLDAGLTGGVAYYHTLTPTLLMRAEVRHNAGLRNISEDTTPESVLKTSSTNLFLGVSYRW